MAQSIPLWLIYILEEYIGVIGNVKCEKGKELSETNFQLFDDQEPKNNLIVNLNYYIDENGNFILKGNGLIPDQEINPTFELYLIITYKCDGKDKKSIRYDIKNLKNMKTIRIKDTIILS